MKDLDRERRERHAAVEAAVAHEDRSFTFGGQTFLYRTIVPYGAIRDLVGIKSDTDDRNVFALLEDATLSMIDPVDDGHARFKAVCNSQDDPVTFEDLNAVSEWLIEVTFNRPPTQSGSSDGTPSQNGTP